MEEICNDILDEIRTQLELSNYICSSRHNILEVWNSQYGRGLYEIKIEDIYVMIYDFNFIYSQKPVTKFYLGNPNVIEQISNYIKQAKPL